MAELQSGDTPEVGDTFTIGQGIILWVRPDGHRQIAGYRRTGSYEVIIENFLVPPIPGLLPIWWADNSYLPNLPDLAGRFVPYPPPSDATQLPRITEEPVNQLPWLHGYTDIYGQRHHGWRRFVAEAAHEAMHWDPDVLVRLNYEQYARAVDQRHTSDQLRQSNMALFYGRVLLGYVFYELQIWEEFYDPANPVGSNTWDAYMNLHVRPLMADICGVIGDEHSGVCENPHWLLEFADNIAGAVPAWEDALAEQAQDQNGKRIIYLPKVIRDEIPWQPGANTPATRYLQAGFDTNPLRQWEDYTRRCIEASRAWRTDYARRPIHDVQ